MPFVLLIIGAILAVAALRNTQSQLATALETDIPGFLKWFAAIAALGALQYVGPLEKPARAMMSLVLLVIFLSNYENVLAALQGLMTAPQPTTPPPNAAAASMSTLASSAGLQSQSIAALEGTQQSNTTVPNLSTSAGGMLGLPSVGGFGASSLTSSGANSNAMSDLEAAGGGLF